MPYICDGECYLNDDGNLVTIHHDIDCESPRSWDNLGTFYTWQRSYWSPDRDAPDFDELVESFGFNPEKVTNPGQLANDLNAHGYIALPVSKYEHSGIVYRAGGPEQFYDPWDSCYVGIIFVSCKRVRREWGKKRVSQKLRNHVYKVLASEVELYSEWADGNCYGFITYDKHGNEIDSCWGFIGGDSETNGMPEQCGGLHECEFDSIDEFLEVVDALNELANEVLDGMTAQYERYAA